MTPIQADKRYDRIPAKSNTLFVSPQPALFVSVVGGARVPINKYLGNLLKEYMLLLIEALRLHKNKMENSTFPFLTHTGDGGVSIKAWVTRYSLNSNSLRAQLRMFKGVWMTNRDLNPELRRYAPGPAQWVDEVIATNKESVLQATAMINEFDIRTRQLQLRSERRDVENTNIQRARDAGGDAPRALLSYNDQARRAGMI